MTIFLNTWFTVISIFILFFYLLYSSKKSYYHKIERIFSFLFLMTAILYFGLRSIHIGTDTLQYYNYYSAENWNMDIAFDFIKNVFLYFNFEFQFFLLGINFLFSFFIYNMYKKNIKELNVFIFILIFLFTSNYVIQMNINILRQGLSLSAFGLGVSLLSLNKKPISFFLFIISILFHKSTIVYILFLLIIHIFNNIYSKYFNLKVKTIIILSSLLVGHLGMINFFFIFLSDNNAQFMKFFTYSHLNGSILIMIFKQLYYIFIFLILSIYINKIRENGIIVSSKIMKMECFIFLTILLSSLLSYNHSISTRYLIIIDFLFPIIIIFIMKSKFIFKDKIFKSFKISHNIENKIYCLILVINLVFNLFLVNLT